jgi:hypothetical protein
MSQCSQRQVNDIVKVHSFSSAAVNSLAQFTSNVTETVILVVEVFDEVDMLLREVMRTASLKAGNQHM